MLVDPSLVLVYRAQVPMLLRGAPWSEKLIINIINILLPSAGRLKGAFLTSFRWSVVISQWARGLLLLGGAQSTVPDS